MRDWAVQALERVALSLDRLRCHWVANLLRDVAGKLGPG